MRKSPQAALVCTFLVLAALPLLHRRAIPGPPPGTVKGGEVHGFVDFMRRTPEIAVTTSINPALQIRLAEAKVYLKDTSGSVASTSVNTNAHGYFMLPRQKPGKYRVCAEYPGLEPGCPKEIVIENETVVLDTDVVLALGTHGAIVGTALLKDGRPCFQDSPIFNTFVEAQVELLEHQKSVLGPIKANSLGQFVLAGAPASGSFELLATCESITVGARVPEIPANGGEIFESLQFKNVSPVIYSMIPSLNGTAVRQAGTGDTLQTTIRPFDADGDTLHFKWTDGTANFPSADTPSIPWKLPAAPATNILFVQARDGKGGYAQYFLTVPASDTLHSLFAGLVADSDSRAPIAGAEVTVNGARTFSSSTGAFALGVTPAQRYVVNVSRAGYALQSQILYNQSSELRFALDRAQTFGGIDPKRGGSFSYSPCRPCEPKRGGVSITIPPNSLVDARGKPLSGPATLELFAYDISLSNPIPGDFSAKTAGGQDARMETFGAAHVQLTDGSGHAVELAPGKKALIRVQVQPQVLAHAPAIIPFFSYDLKTGYWKYETDAHLVGGQYVAQVGHFSQFNADTVFTNTACIRFTVHDLDPNHIAPQLPFLIDASIPLQNGTVNHHNVPITDFVNGVFRLPPNIPVTLIVRPLNDPNYTITSLTVNSGNAISNSFNGFPPFDYSACNGFDPGNPAPGNPVVLTIPLPQRSQQFLSIYASGASAQVSQNYYQAVDPQNNLGTLTQFKTAFGFSQNPSSPAAGEAEGIYYNNADLQLGRDMHCLQSGGKTACYVSNYSPTGPGGDPQSSISLTIARGTPIATVAMTYDPNAQNAENVQFYVYDATGNRLNAAVLDSEGPKFVPQICLACHGGTFSSNNPGPVAGASFLPFDTSSFIYDTSPAGYSLTNQQEGFRQLNNLVNGTSPNSSDPNNPIGSLIASWYSCGVSNFGCQTNNTPGNPNPLPLSLVPSGWQAHADLYSTITQHRCRTCHTALSSSVDWTSYSQWDPTFKGLIQTFVCTNPGAHLMPHAEVPFKTFWTSTNPHEPEYLSGPAPGLNFGAGSCVP